jgi:hypothetical protein
MEKNPDLLNITVQTLPNDIDDADYNEHVTTDYLILTLTNSSDFYGEVMIRAFKPTSPEGPPFLEVHSTNLDMIIEIEPPPGLTDLD